MGEVSLETSPKNIMIQDMINSGNSMRLSIDGLIFSMRVIISRLKIRNFFNLSY